MDINRNQWFLAGLVLLYLGIQFRMIDSFVLTPEVTQFLAEQTDHPKAAMNAKIALFMPDDKPAARKTVEPNDWIGWALVAVGATMVLHSLSLPRPSN